MKMVDKLMFHNNPCQDDQRNTSMVPFFLAGFSWQLHGFGQDDEVSVS
jgi:hypothetical protein